jgi:beta-1,4-N-acetylglucosaminyltransferase
MRLLLVCSPGGHLQTLSMMAPAWRDMERSWVTLEGPDVDSLLTGEDVTLGHGPTNRSVVNFFRNLRLAWRVLRERRPKAILSTGAGVAVPFYVVGKMLGIRLVYVESLARTETLSLSGRLVYPLVDRFFVLWPALAEKHRRAEYAGTVL